jgi:predicted DNA-binding transcriptional regulator AlpA
MDDVELLRERQLIVRYGFTAAWLRRARREGRGPKFLRLGRMIFYRRAHVEGYLAAHEVETNGPAQPRA